MILEWDPNREIVKNHQKFTQNTLKMPILAFLTEFPHLLHLGTHFANYNQ